MIFVIHIFIATIIILGVAIIALSRNVIHAAYALALTLVGVAGLYVLMSAELLAVVQLLIYAGGVVILMSFGIMLTQRLSNEQVLSESRNKILGFIVSLAIFIGLSYLISKADFRFDEVPTGDSTIERIGVSFLTDHLVAFELIAFILLVALVGAAYIAKMSADE